MKTLKKIFITSALVTFAASAFAQGYDLSFSNKLSSNLVDHTKVNSASASQFSGIKNRAEAELLSDRVDIGVMYEYIFKPLQSQTEALADIDHDGYQFELNDSDFYLEFRPIHQLTLGYCNEVKAWGSYLPVWDDSLAGANFTTSDGMSLTIRPVDDLRIGFGIDQSIFNSDANYQKPIFNFGADYNYKNLVKAGFAVRNAAEANNKDIGVGVFLQLNTIDNISLNLGFEHNDYDGVDFYLINDTDSYGAKYKVQGENIATLGATYKSGKFRLDIDTVINLKATENTGTAYDTYIGAIAALDVTKVINLSVKGIIGLDRDSAENEKDPYMAVAPSATFTLAQRHQIGLGFQYESCDNNYAYNFPVYYKYSF